MTKNNPIKHEELLIVNGFIKLKDRFIKLSAIEEISSLPHKCEDHDECGIDGLYEVCTINEVYWLSFKEWIKIIEALGLKECI